MNPKLPIPCFDFLLKPPASHSRKAAIVAPGRHALSHAGLAALMDTTGEVLRRHGIQTQTRVAIVLPQGPELATACLAFGSATVIAPVNPESRDSEFRHYFASLAADALLTTPGSSLPAEQVAAELGIPVIELHSSQDAAAGEFRLQWPAAPITPRPAKPASHEDTALLLQTSGTTALPRSVRLTHGNLASSIDNLVRSLALNGEDVCLHLLPMFHIGGIVDVLAAPLRAGGTVVCTSGFSIPEFYRCLSEFRPTWTQAVPAMIRELVKTAPDHVDEIGTHRLRLMRSVSAPLPVSLMREFESIFGIPIIEIYGMSETAGLICSNPLADGQRKPGSVGVAAGPEVRIVDGHGTAVPDAQIGEIVVRGDNVMPGYENDPDPGSRFYGEWLRTGDQGYRDADGYFFLTGRIKEIINRGGEKISPGEVDNALHGHPAVADAAAFSVTHDSLGEDVAAAVVLKPGWETTRHELTEYLSARLAYFKVPRTIHFVDRIPRTAGGKIQRHNLSHELARKLVPINDVANSRPPDTIIEKWIASAWSRILKTDAIGVDDDFFDLGGDSLKAASFVNELQRSWNETIYVSAVFDAPTIGRFEQYLEANYPVLCLKILGKSIQRSDARDLTSIDEATFASFTRSVHQPTSSSKAVADRNPRAVFVLSPPRSGSTLFRAMLAGHPDLFAPPELYLLSFDDLAQRRDWFSGSQRFQLEGNLRCLMQARGCTLQEARDLMTSLENRRMPTWEYYRLLQSAIGSRLLIDKTPFYASHKATLLRAENYFEGAQYIHLLRHPYGVIRSFEEAHLGQLWYPRLAGPDAARERANPFPDRQLAEMIWTTLQENIVGFLQGISRSRQLEIRFENLVSDPQAVMNKVCDFVGVDLDPDMLKPLEDPSKRMTDGVLPESRMIGDMKFHDHRSIDETVADRWKKHYDTDFLCSRTLDVARTLGYLDLVADSRQRSEFEI